MTSTRELLDFDRAHIWHPYTSMVDPAPVHLVRRADGCQLELDGGQRVVDGMSSWWCAIHGYNVPELNRALVEQAERMAHVMFGGLTHEPAIELCRRLVALTPEPLQHVFLCDSGSVSVEVAIKMALQYQQAVGQTQRRRLITWRSGYHGDTFGAMSVCDPVGGMHALFRGVLPEHVFVPRPELRPGDPWDDSCCDELERAFAEHGETLAAAIVEPIVQGAGGMWFHHPNYLVRLRELCDRYGVLLIADEIATGFGRTGRMFAVEHAGVCPDILCLGKALTGGTMTMAATLATTRVAHGISSAPPGVFMHGPTFMGNPLAAAVSCASIDLLCSGPWQRRVAAIEAALRAGLEVLRDDENVVDVRCLGAIGVVELERPVNNPDIGSVFIRNGAWIRPFRHLVYVMPPFVISERELNTLTSAMIAGVRSLGST